MGIEYLTIKGYKSIRELEKFPLRPLNILIGANGSGKSNFISFFRLLAEMIQGRLQHYVAKEGGPELLLHLGSKHTDWIEGAVYFDVDGYEFELEPTTDNRLTFRSESLYYRTKTPYSTGTLVLPPGTTETRLADVFKQMPDPYAAQLRSILTSATVYHFHDTGETAKVKKIGALNDNEKLRNDAGNLAAFLFLLREQGDPSYNRIREVVSLAAPFFDDFILRPIPLNPDTIQLEWTQRNADYPFHVSQLSDGVLRFICLATALLQPNPPSTMLIDEPELGLHPYALELLAGLLKEAAHRTQVIVSTQSAALVDHFEPEDVIVVDRQGDESLFRRLESEPLREWLGEYSLGELWWKNVLGGTP